MWKCWINYHSSYIFNAVFFTVPKTFGAFYQFHDFYNNNDNNSHTFQFKISLKIFKMSYHLSKKGRQWPMTWREQEHWEKQTFRNSPVQRLKPAKPYSGLWNPPIFQSKWPITAGAVLESLEKY